MVMASTLIANDMGDPSRAASPDEAAPLRCRQGVAWVERNFPALPHLFKAHPRLVVHVTLLETARGSSLEDPERPRELIL